MGRFINLGIAIVNTSYIIRVEMESDGRAEIYMSDGTMFRCDHFDASQLYGTNEKKEGVTSLHLQEELRYRIESIRCDARRLRNSIQRRDERRDSSTKRREFRNRNA